MPNATSRAFLWENGAMRDLGAPTSGISIARATNSSGQAADTAITPAYQGHAYLWSSGMTDLGSLGTGDSQAWGLDDAGQVVGFTVVGALSVSRGGRLHCRKIYLGQAGTGRAGYLTGDGGQVRAFDVLRVGEAGSCGGTMELLNGGIAATEGTFAWGPTA